MTISPLNYAESLRIGTVEFVSPNEIKAAIEIDAPDGVALNTGVPRSFPRINGYVLIPSEDGQLVAQVEWITIERSDFPKRRGMKDFGLIDLPYPRRKMSLNPLGVLYESYADNDDTTCYEFERGVRTFPTVGEPVVLPTEIQLRSIIESGKNRHVKIGTSPLAANAEVRVDPDRIFGRHLAVLGNTGSGKSCSVAGLIRWSLEAAQAKNKEKAANARFIVLDPNGEYARAFKDDEGATIYSVAPQETKGEKQLNVPLWFWNSEEWAAFTQASSQTQKPVLIQALRAVREEHDWALAQPTYRMRQLLRTYVTILKHEQGVGTPSGGFPKSKHFTNKLKKWREDIKQNVDFSPEENTALSEIRNIIEPLIDARTGQYISYDFSNVEIEKLIEVFQSAHHVFGGTERDYLPISADIPKPFTGDDLLKSVEAVSAMLNVSQYTETMQLRIRSLLSDQQLASIISEEQTATLDKWLIETLGQTNNDDTPTITIIDLSLVPAEVTHIITSVIARMTLEALQRYRKLKDGKVLPTVLVMEEAHTFIKRYNHDAENQDAAMVCCKVFEKIAREGRKYGLGLVLSSQRPSELSPTVLSQCNSFLLHRLSNDRDQELVGKLVPDNLHGLLRDLPALPSRQAILLGWAAELPILVEMNKLPEHHRPRSDDPDFWKVWTGEARDVDWGEIAADWQGTPNGITSDSDGGAGFEADTQDFGDGDIPF